jgi:hypothetical protein
VSKTTASRGRLTCEEEPGLELVSTELATCSYIRRPGSDVPPAGSGPDVELLGMIAPGK